MTHRLSRPVRVAARTAVVLGLLAAASCSSGSAELNSVTGKVLVNGQPAAGAFVMFIPEAGGSTPSTGIAGADGTFTLATGSGKGVPAGKYVVTVTVPDPKKKVSDAQKMMGMDDAPDLLGGRYATREKSTLRAEVKPGENKLDPFDIK
jgi:hypothetical protein